MVPAMWPVLNLLEHLVGEAECLSFFLVRGGSGRQTEGWVLALVCSFGRCVFFKCTPFFFFFGGINRNAMWY